MMTSPSRLTEDKAAHREHLAWLNDCGRWRSEHRQTLAALAKVQASIMEQEAALESHAANVQAHEMHLQKYGLTEPGDADYELFEREHAEFTQRHVSAQEAHERIKKHHISILGEVEKLLNLCKSGM